MLNHEFHYFLKEIYWHQYHFVNHQTAFSSFTVCFSFMFLYTTNTHIYSWDYIVYTVSKLSFPYLYFSRFSRKICIRAVNCTTRWYSALLQYHCTNVKQLKRMWKYEIIPVYSQRFWKYFDSANASYGVHSCEFLLFGCIHPTMHYDPAASRKIYCLWASACVLAGTSFPRSIEFSGEAATWRSHVIFIANVQ